MRSFFTLLVVVTVRLSHLALPLSSPVSSSSLEELSDSSDDEAQSSLSMSSKFFCAFLGFSTTDSSSELSSDDDSSSDEEDSSLLEDEADSSSASGFALYSWILASNSLLWRRSCSFILFKARPFAFDIFFWASLSLSATS